jgi:SAM-dependent methyltransferase
MQREIDWTGERCVPWANAAQVIYEHYHRYCLAARWLGDMDVLDAACGEGYGADILANTAKSVVAIDIDPSTVRHATQNYTKPNLRFHIGDIQHLTDLGPKLFDAVVCFEAIEHVTDHCAVMTGIKEVLRPSGLVIMSTPDKTTYNAQNTHNPFHLKELTAAEFELLLRRHFSNVALLGQSVSSGSTIVGLLGDTEPGTIDMTPFSKHAEGWRFRFTNRPTYLIAIASDAPLPSIPETSLLIDDGAELVAEAWRYHAQASTDLDKARSTLDSAHAEQAALTSRLDEAASLNEKLRKELSLTRDDLAAATLQLTRTQAKLDTAILECNRLRSELSQEITFSEELFRQLSELRSSLPMKLWRQYAVLRDQALRKGSKTRDLYDKVAHTLLTLREPHTW